MTSTVKVEFSEGPRQIKPTSWEHRNMLPPRPIFDIPGYSVMETCDGRYLAIKVE